MKRLPLVLAILIAAIINITCIIPCFALWLLGANKPWSNLIKAFEIIVFDK